MKEADSPVYCKVGLSASVPLVVCLCFVVVEASKELNQVFPLHSLSLDTYFIFKHLCRVFTFKSQKVSILNLVNLLSCDV